ncbi:YkgJ family cysteine cluster protein [Akkermansiaceae bacterium]|nr:YkgJ family cysteine cluster protein [Akkermansiaceae bacterium]MDA8960720.1 YkgJ family cysteine cluster protein [Akkermansiaceae bacterium]
MADGEDDPWYQCQRCTNCCKWEGDVVLADGEVERIAEFLEMPLYQFVKDFTRLRDNRQGLSLIDKQGTSECVMLDGVDCRLQAVKPFQCTGFPNRWNFENWREACEAIPAPRPGRS